MRGEASLVLRFFLYQKLFGLTIKEVLDEPIEWINMSLEIESAFKEAEIKAQERANRKSQR